MKIRFAFACAAALFVLCDGSLLSSLHSAAGHLNADVSGLLSDPVPAGERRLTAQKAAQAFSREAQIPLEKAWPSLLLAFIAGMSTVIGGLVVFGMEGSPPPKAMAFSLSLAAGVMVAVSFEMLWPHEHENEEHEHAHHHDEDALSWGTVLMLFIFGALLCLCLSWLGNKFAEYVVVENGEDQEPETNPNETAAGEAETPPSSENAKKEFGRKKESMRLAFLLFVSLTAHNFPEGFAVAVTTLSSQQLGLMICFAIALHNIPEGIAIAVSTYDATLDKWLALRMTAYSGLSEPLGAFCALVLLQSVLTPRLIQALLTVVAGIMCYVALAELLPEAVSKHEHAWTVCGFITGIAVMVATHEALEYYSAEHGGFE